MEAYQDFKRKKMHWLFIVLNEFIEAIYLALTFFMSSSFSPRKQIQTTNFAEISWTMLIVSHPT